MKKGIFLFIILLSFLVHSNAQSNDDFVTIKNESSINSELLEYSPAFYEDGLVFISTKVANSKKKKIDKNINKNMMSIYRAKRNSEGLLETPEVFAPELLSKYHEGPLTFDRINETMYFSRNNMDKGKIEQRRMKIFSSTKVGREWMSITELPFNGADFETVHPSISANGDALYFASDREGGMGGMDIWVAYKTGDNWSEPINLGRSVNTPGNEVFPYISAGGTLYFSSNGIGSGEDLDIYQTMKGMKGWNTPIKLEPPFNSPEDDFGFIIDRDNKNGYFSSARVAGGLGGDDIYSFNLKGDGGPVRIEVEEPPVVSTGLVVRDSDGNPIEDVKYSYINMDNMTLGEAVNGGVLRLVPSPDGQSYTIDFDQSQPIVQDESGNVAVPDGNVIMKVEKDGYLPQYVTVTPQMVESGIFIDMVPEGTCMSFGASVLSSGDGRPISGATVTVTEKESSKAVTLISDNLGQVDYCLECDKEYIIVAMLNGQVSEFATVATYPCTREKGVASTLYLNGGETIAEGTVIKLPNIYFNFNDASLRPDSKKDLEAVVAFMETFPNIELEMASHTDSRGPSEYNLNLSQKRSDNAVAYLVDRGAPSDRIQARGYGETQLTNNCADGVRCKERDHQKNRRTELVVTNVGPVEAEQIQSHTPATAQPVSYESDMSYESSNAVANSTGRHYVVAGSFGVSENAYKTVTRLQDLGYQDVSIVDFGYKDLKSVCVASFDSRREAKKFSKKLRRKHQIKAFVKSIN